MPNSVNEQIAKLLGWKPPTQAYKDQAIKGGRDAEWCMPDGRTLAHLPLFDSDWQATGELLKQCFDVGIEKYECGFSVSLSVDGERWSSAKAVELTAAIAEAWLSAMKGKMGE